MTSREAFPDLFGRKAGAEVRGGEFPLMQKPSLHFIWTSQISLTLSLCLPLPLFLCHGHMRAHTDTHTHTHKLSHSHKYSLQHSSYVTYKHKHTHTRTHTRIFVRTLTLCHLGKQPENLFSNWIKSSFHSKVFFSFLQKIFPENLELLLLVIF